MSKVQKEIVFVGGGQSHAPVLKMLGMRPTANINITLISANSVVPYSGMLPGYIAGSYTKEQCLLDLRHISNFAGANFIQANVTGLDLQKQLVLLENRPPIPYDILSLNVGIVPDLDSIVGREHITPVKPAIAFFEKWESILHKIEKGDYGKCFRIGILGAGAGGIELAFTMQKRLMDIIPNVEVHVFQREKEILHSLNDKTKLKVIRLLKEKKIQLHTQEEISNIVSIDTGLSCKSVRGNEFQLDFVVGAVKAKSLSWIEECDLQKDENGFILVNDSLQSFSHPNVFAVGDIANMKNHPRPKAGVFAVRQSVPLYENLIRFIEDKPLVKFKPQEKFLTLLNIGDGRAIASRGNYSLGASNWIWKWKDKIDTEFMQKFQNLPVKMSLSMDDKQSDELLCKGCGSKVGSDILKIALDRLEIYLATLKRPKSSNSKYAKTLVGLKQREDSALIQISQKVGLIQSVDYFKPIVSDLFISGQIAANHCLNDLYAKGVNAHSAQAIINLDEKSSRSSEDLFQVLAGAATVFSKEGVELLGGHTNSGKEFGLGFVCNGFQEKENFYSKKNAKVDDLLILTKPIGVGLAFAADMRNRVRPNCVDAAIQSMLLSNYDAIGAMKKYTIHSCTDITGFGLAGHLLEILKASNLKAEIQLDKIPLLKELNSILEKNPEIQSSLFPSNWKSFESFSSGNKSHPTYRVLFDPQTSGGLLFTIKPTEGEKCLAELKRIGYDASIIGSVKKLNSDKVKLVECG
ncbi:MAG: selenide, water dikinase SelD [Leptospiraceae bacterium]|nr:selenide, water dikinase SelD [Leptospiraceae bacterium]MBK7054173.1 selenide, water dikinase SelD [Leptospiraceae bacterium]MBK9499701.1 selenide, water dikinase SelD [Leptospiraceae bacterium]